MVSFVPPTCNMKRNFTDSSIESSDPNKFYLSELSFNVSLGHTTQMMVSYGMVP